MNNNPNMTEQTSNILERFKAVKPIDKPKFIPYNENEGDIVRHISPFLDYIYNFKLPEVYRTYDKPLGEPLYRFLQAIFEGGFAPLVNKFQYGEEHDPSDTEKINLGGIENLLELVDPQTCPDSFLPYYCKSFGLEWFPDLAKTPIGMANHDYYNRTFLCNVGEIIRRRGTESCIKFIAKVLTGMDVTLSYMRIFDTEDETKTVERKLLVNMLARSLEDVANVGINSEVIKRYIASQIPHYITPDITYNILNKVETRPYHACYIKKSVSYVIQSDDVIN